RVEEVGEPQPVPGEPVEPRRLDLATVAADVGIAQVVGQDDDDIGLLVRLRQSARGESRETENHSRHDLARTHDSGSLLFTWRHLIRLSAWEARVASSRRLRPDGYAETRRRQASAWSRQRSPTRAGSGRPAASPSCRSTAARASGPFAG